jgi:hypothetical protein
MIFGGPGVRPAWLWPQQPEETHKSVMDQPDPCARMVGWSTLHSATADLTLAGVLAGFLIAVVAALLAQWYDRASRGMIALFASGVPALTLSSYTFSISTGVTLPDTLWDGYENYCGQVWSQWLPAFAMLLIGGSVLLCGLGWALVIYSDNLAEKVKEKVPPETIEDTHRFFIGLSAWLSLGGTAGMAGLLIAANVLYLQAIKRAPLTFFEFPPGVKWYAVFFVYLFGVYVIVRSAYLVIWRATSFRREPVPGVYTKSPTLRGARDNKRARRVAKEIGIANATAVGALLASYLTTAAVHEWVSVTTTPYTVVVVVVAYTIGRLAYCVVVHVVRQIQPSMSGGQATTKGYAEGDAKIRVTPSTEKPKDASQIKYSGGRLKATSYNVVFFAILGTIFAEVLTQAPLISPNWRTGLSLFIGGLYPAWILLGLSYSVPAAPSTKLPEWKMRRGLRLAP